MLALVLVSASLTLAQQPTAQAKTIWATQKDTVWRMEVKYKGEWLPGGSAVAVTYGTRQYIVTCKHVTEATYEIYKDGKPVKVKFDGYRAKRGSKTYETGWQSHPVMDIAAIRVDGLSPTARIAFIKPEVGEKVYSLGFPGNESLTIGEGIINRKTQIGGREYLGSSADIYFGNSGGGLWTESAEVVGINSNWIPATNNLYWAECITEPIFKNWLVNVK